MTNSTVLDLGTKGHDGGLMGEEGLTLPYTKERYEVACNLLHPDVGVRWASRDHVDEASNRTVQSRGQLF